MWQRLTKHHFAQSKQQKFLSLASLLWLHRCWSIFRYICPITEKSPVYREICANKCRDEDFFVSRYLFFLIYFNRAQYCADYNCQTYIPWRYFHLCGYRWFIVRCVIWKHSIVFHKNSCDTCQSVQNIFFFPTFNLIHIITFKQRIHLKLVNYIVITFLV